MAGNDRQRAIEANYTRHADDIFDMLASGRPVREIIARFGGSRTVLHYWTKAVPERDALWKAARKLSAEAHAELAGDELSRNLMTPAEVALGNARAKYHQWLAEKFDRETFGDPKAGVNLTLNVGQLHLAALQAAGRSELADGIVVEAQVEAIEPAGALPAATDEGDDIVAELGGL